MKPIVNLYNLGRAPYVRALRIQQLLFDKLKNYKSHSPSINGNTTTNCNNYALNTSANTTFITNNKTINHVTTLRSSQSPSPTTITNSLLLVEHEPVYTVGIRTKEYNDNYVLKLKEELDKHQMKADFVRTNRGGLITFHGPGQLVAYPIIYLGDFTSKIPNKSVKAYVNRLESTIIDTLTAAGLQGAHTMREYPGVWLDEGDRKIAFIGISCKRYVTMHGISINCDCNLSWFDHIVSCGIEDKSITSIRQEMSYKNDLQHLSNQTNLSNTSLSKLSTIASDAQSLSNFSSNQVGETSEGMFDLKQESSKYTVERVANIFCQSFSVNFDCDLRCGNLEQDIGVASDALSLECQQ